MKYPISFEIGFKKHKYAGKLIAIEGIDGSGKTTQAKELVRTLKKQGIKAIYTKEPTDGPIGKLIRQVLSRELKIPPMSLQYLFCADRGPHQEEMEKKLKAGYVVVTDRYFWSAVAYGMSDLNGSPDFYSAAFSILSMYNQFLAPDHTIFLNLDVDQAFKRISKSSKHTEIYDKKDKLINIRNAYMKLIKKFSEEFTLVDANKDVNDVNEELLKIVRKQ